MVFNYLILLLFLLNFKQSSELKIRTVYPIYIKKQESGTETLILTFDESVANDNSDLIFVFENDQNKQFTFKRIRSPKIDKIINRADFTIEYDKFNQEELNGYYRIYFGDVQNNI